MLIVDAHLDLAMNALVTNRDLRLGARETRRIEQEAGLSDDGQGAGTVGFPDLRAAGVGICLATVCARVRASPASRLDYRTQESAYAHTQGELAYYRELARQGLARIITDAEALDAQVAAWERDPAQAPFGLILLMECADAIVDPGQLPLWWEQGLRVIGLSHYGPGVYAYGTQSVGGITPRGRELLGVLAETGMILDLSHLVDDGFWEALDLFPGTVLASHANCRALVPGDRQLSDEMIRAVIARDGVIGAALDAWMLQPGWIQHETRGASATLDAYVDHLDRVCQIAGNARHAGIGTDLDGGYGTEQTPRDLDTIADLQRVPALLAQRGYSDDDIALIMHGNWLRLFRRAWPTSHEPA